MAGIVAGKPDSEVLDDAVADALVAVVLVVFETLGCSIVVGTPCVAVAAAAQQLEHLSPGKPLPMHGTNLEPPPAVHELPAAQILVIGRELEVWLADVPFQKRACLVAL